MSITLSTWIEGDDVDLLKPGEFYEIVREERQFCAILAHLIMERGGNLRRFIDLIYGKLGRNPLPPNTSLEDAEFYLEFSYLRDFWKSLGDDYEVKRNLIFELIAKVPALRQLSSSDFPTDILDFNRTFMGSEGKVSEIHVVMPGQWDVQSLFKQFGDDNDVFHALCSFKWAFNIKPDLVFIIPGLNPICIEAKLESRVGGYPSGGAESKLFDRVFGEKQGRVDQVELQRFLFGTLLENPCDSILVGRKAPQSGFHHAFISWRELFAELDMSSSVTFVEKLVAENRYL